MIVVDGVAIFDVPDSGQDGLRERPLQRARMVQLQAGAENFETALDGVAIDEEFGQFDRVSQQRADFVFQLAYDTFRIDRDPTAIAIEEHVVMLQIAVQQHRCSL